ncbi:sensor histidine kinase [Vallitalea okinawensis]|uniref:sensor histidine kinase n=1 Tax=Vallitalea okinawensis TaxID=2078660 RepID=UPI000CFDB226|nr:ATP-binding protein [Vallitalea okinawensis]
MSHVLKDIKEYTKASDNLKMIILYRNFSTLITSIFYLISNNNPILVELIVISSVIISSRIIMKLYKRNINDRNFVKVLTIIETLGISLILIPTGGLDSAYIWYALNTILVSIFFLPKRYKWINLFLYLIITLTISYRFINSDQMFIYFVISHSNLILSFILMTVVLTLLFKQNKMLNNKGIELIALNAELTQIYERSNESIDYIMGLYQAIESLSTQHSKEETIKLLVKYIKKITKSTTVIFYYTEDDDYRNYGLENLSEERRYELEQRLERDFYHIQESDEPSKIELNSQEYILINISSSYKHYGILGIENNKCSSSLFYHQNIKQLNFLSDLSSIILEKLNLEEMNERMLINEEQNRIANEIHDSVCQRLFAISCATHALHLNHSKMTSEEYEDIICDIKNASQLAMKELRTVIYKLSWKEKGENTFESEVKDYINGLSKLHNVNINLTLNGNQELLNFNLKKGIYRIICESTGNAIRHGKAKNIDICISINPQSLELMILDNGVGFDEKSKKSNKGLGLKNIYNLVYALKGHINIDSNIGKGTNINIVFEIENISLVI